MSEPRRFGKSTSQYKKEVRRHEAVERRASNHNHFLGYLLDEHIAAGLSEEEALKQAQSSFLASFGDTPSSTHEEDSVAKVIIALMGIGVILALIYAIAPR